MPGAEGIQPAKDAVQQDQLVEQLRPDPTQAHPDVITLAGFVGKSTQQGYVRLYLTADLNTYAEIPADAIVQRQAITSGETTMTGSMLWVKVDTTIEQYTRISIPLRQAQFLSGNLSPAPSIGQPAMTGADAAALSSAGAQGANAVPKATFLIFCPPPKISHACEPVPPVEPGAPPAVEQEG